VAASRFIPSIALDTSALFADGWSKTSPGAKKPIANAIYLESQKGNAESCEAKGVPPMKRLVALSVLVLACVSLLWTPRAHTAPDDEAEIRELYDRWAKAARTHDVNAVMSIYPPGKVVVAYDIVAPLQYIGNDAYRKDYEEFFAQYEGPIDIQYRDLRIVAGDRVAFIHALERISGTLKNGQKSDVWTRATSGLRKINGKWLIVHDHISVPVDLDSGKALLNLKP
jgi:uncharacterized protein (TIGR02246 family)